MESVASAPLLSVIRSMLYCGQHKRSGGDVCQKHSIYQTGTRPVEPCSLTPWDKAWHWEKAGLRDTVDPVRQLQRGGGEEAGEVVRRRQEPGCRDWRDSCWQRPELPEQKEPSERFGRVFCEGW